jgi:hypothetical protein
MAIMYIASLVIPAEGRKSSTTKSGEKKIQTK